MFMENPKIVEERASTTKNADEPSMEFPGVQEDSEVVSKAVDDETGDNWRESSKHLFWQWRRFRRLPNHSD